MTHFSKTNGSLSKMMHGSKAYWQKLCDYFGPIKVHITFPYWWAMFAFTKALDLTYKSVVPLF